jgi:O-antigen ligase
VAIWLLGAMIVWSLFAVAGVYVWAGVPLMIAAALLAVASRRAGRTSSDTRLLDAALVATVVVAAANLLPVPSAVRALLSPQADDVRAALFVAPGDPRAWRPLALSPDQTAYAIGLLLTAVIVFRAARRVFADGGVRRIVRLCAYSGMVAAFLAIALSTTADPTLIYGRWPAIDAGARPYGPFVNRNHFATWLLMACPLAAGYVAARLDSARPSAVRLSAGLLALAEFAGTSVLWVGVSAVVMTIALVISTSRSGLTAFAVSIAVGAWLVRARLTRRTRVLALAAVVMIGAIVLAFVNVHPLLARVDETLTVGTAGRPRIWQETWRIVREFWLTGTGLGGYQTAMAVTQQGDRTVFINQAHNQYLQLLAEGGVLLTLCVAVAAIAFVRLFRKRLAEDSSSSVWLRIGAGIAILGVAVQGLWETGLRIPANGVLFAIAAAVAVYPVTRDRAGPDAATASRSSP